jgi:hypothetical protein
MCLGLGRILSGEFHLLWSYEVARCVALYENHRICNYYTRLITELHLTGKPQSE